MTKKSVIDWMYTIYGKYSDSSIWPTRFLGHDHDDDDSDDLDYNDYDHENMLQEDEELRRQIVKEGVFYHTYKDFPLKETEELWSTE